MRRTLIIYLTVLAAGVWTGTNAWAQEQSQRARDFIYGYAPGQLTQETGTADISTTAEEEGHHLEGVTDLPPLRRLTDPAVPAPAPVASDSNGADDVLISVPRPQRNAEELRPRTEANRHSAQVNDSQNIDREIEQHRWTVPFLTTFTLGTVATVPYAVLFFPCPQFISARGVRGRYVDIQCLKRCAPGVADLVRLSPFDQKQSPRLEPMTFSGHDRLPRSRFNEQPLIAAAMTVIRAAFLITRRDHHLGRLGPAVADHHLKIIFECQIFFSHGASLSIKRRNRRSNTAFSHVYPD